MITGAAKTARFNELLTEARSAAGWVRQLADHAYALAQDADHQGHREQLQRIAEAAAGFADQISRTRPF